MAQASMHRVDFVRFADSAVARGHYKARPSEKLRTVWCAIRVPTRSSAIDDCRVSFARVRDPRKNVEAWTYLTSIRFDVDTFSRETARVSLRSMRAWDGTRYAGDEF